MPQTDLPDPRIRVLAVASHPVQYSAPLFRLLAQHLQLDFHVAYCSLRGAEPGHDPEFGRDVQWDVPLLDGYPWTHIPNYSSGKESFFGLYNPGLWTFVRAGHFDAVLCYTGYPRASFWITYFASKLSGTAFLFGTDAITLAARDGIKWKELAKRLFWPWLFRLADNVVVPSSRTRQLIRTFGIPEDRITLTPYTVNNDWWIRRAAAVDRDAARASLGIPSGSLAVLFCAKLQPWKRPLDLLYAAAACKRTELFLILAGDGPLRASLEAEAAKLGMSAQVKFLGFVNQQALPEIYRSADLMVLPSDYEPFGVVVNEAVLCGCPVIASDHVGAAFDLIAPFVPEFVFPSGDIPALSGALLRVLDARHLLKEAHSRMLSSAQAWSPARNIATTVDALYSAVRRSAKSRETTGRSSVSPARDATSPANRR